MAMRNRLYRSGNALLEEIKATTLDEQAAVLWYLGQSGIMVKFMNTVILFDPHLEDSLAERSTNPCIRNYPSPIDPALLNFVDYIFITHNHADHLEPATVKKIAQVNFKAKYIIPYPVKDALAELGIPEDRIIGAKSDTPIQGDVWECLPVPAAHYEIRRDAVGNAWELGYVVRLGQITIYHSGDTIVYPGLVQILKESAIDIAMLPINGRDWVRDAKGIIGNIGFKEAADLGVAICADLLIPLHFDLYNHNTENPGYLVDYLYRQYPGMKYHLFQPGERFIYLK
jgi:L-ascorbate 6-phosphate lactonase